MDGTRASDGGAQRDARDPDERPEQSADDSGAGWGDEVREDAESDRDEWYLRERPPHHGT